MATLPENSNTTAAQIDAWWEANQEGGNRPHLGASVIGRSCDRALWYGFRWASTLRHSGRMLRLFDRGQKEEDRFFADLRRIGVTVYDLDPTTGRQFSFSALGGHFGGSMDCALQGIPESKAWHVGECKTHSDKSFKQLATDGVLSAKPEHFMQMQCYMHWTGMTRALYMAVNKNDDSLYFERVKYDAGVAEGLLARAEAIITAPVPPAGISADPSWYECKWCDHNAVCHERAIPPANCRTCAHSTPELDGDARWSCAVGSDIDTATQRLGCDDHRFNPCFINGEVVSVTDEAVEYRMADGTTLINGNRDGFRSAELFAAGLGKIASLSEDPTFAAVRQLFAARVVA